MSKALANQGAGTAAKMNLAVRGIDACASSLLDGIGGHDLWGGLRDALGVLGFAARQSKRRCVRRDCP
jgi:hypothetical protein